MSIAMERFESTGTPADARVLSGSRNLCFPYRVQCRSCGFQPVSALTRRSRCPKCSASGWERFIVPRSLLMQNDQRAGDARLAAKPELEHGFPNWSQS
jgi:hypothetical protein